MASNEHIDMIRRLVASSLDAYINSQGSPERPSWPQVEANLKAIVNHTDALEAELDTERARTKTEFEIASGYYRQLQAERERVRRIECAFYAFIEYDFRRTHGYSESEIREARRRWDCAAAECREYEDFPKIDGWGKTLKEES